MTLAEWKTAQLKRWGIESDAGLEWRVLEKKTAPAFVQGKGNEGEPNDMAIVGLYLGNKEIVSEAIDVPALTDDSDFFDVQSVKLANEKARADALAAELEPLKEENETLKAELDTLKTAIEAL